jgi:hypothetical protein
MELIETSVPRTPHGQEYGEWAKLLNHVDPLSIDGYGFDGEWVQRGAVTYAIDGAVILECAGFKTRRDQEAARGRLFVLWKFNGQTWEELSRSDDRDWAVRLRSRAARALEE